MRLFVTCTILWFVPSVFGTVASDMERLYNNIKTGYNRHILPVQDHNTPVPVVMNFFMGTIKGFTEKDAHFTITASFVFSWYDYRLMWNSSEYGGIQDIVLPITKVWIPPMYLYNPFSNSGEISNDRMKVTNNNGFIIWHSYVTLDVLCSADVTYYPFDSHACYFFFYTESYSTSKINVTLYSNVLDLTFLSENPLWEFDKENSRMFVKRIIGDNAAAVIVISFKRRPAFYVINLIVPTSVINILNSLVFVLPAEAGERISFSVTMLLAMAVFQTIVSDSLPTAALPNIPRLCYFLLVDLIIGALITMCTMFVLKIYFKKETERVTGCLLTLTSWTCKRKWRKEIKQEIKSSLSDITWHDVGQVLDTVLFYFFFIAILIKNILLVAMFFEERPLSLINDYL